MAALISPSILSADLTRLGEELQACEAAGADAIHIDVMDGRFVPNITFGPDIVAACKKVTSLPLDVHLMIVEPEKHLEAFANAGADFLTVHYETCPHIHRTLQTIRELGVKPGLTFNPGTPVEPLELLADMVELVLIMSVNPGFGGQSFIPQAIGKIRQTRAILEAHGSNAIVQVDGGITAATIRATYDAGARNFVAGTAVFRHQEGIAGGVSALREALN
ncbi:MAG TPA: ribulose-phosphate 3-epimerase [Anaerolineaceae bacterium]|nr:ribulose-phosphate 3-epimerase [Anaerolineaceae bacterium]